MMTKMSFILHLFCKYRNLQEMYAISDSSRRGGKAIKRMQLTENEGGACDSSI